MNGPDLFCKPEIVDELSAVDVGSIRLAAISVIDDVAALEPGHITSMCLLLRDLESGISIREALNKLDDSAIKPLFDKFRAQSISVGITFRQSGNHNEETKYLDLAEAEALIHSLLESSWNGRDIRLQISRE